MRPDRRQPRQASLYQTGRPAPCQRAGRRHGAGRRTGSPTEVGRNAMTIGPDDNGFGSAKTDDRFGGQLGGYRGSSRRDSSAVLPIDGTGSDDLSPRNGSMPSLERVGAALDGAPIASSLTAPRLAEPTLSELGSLSDSMFNHES